MRPPALTLAAVSLLLTACTAGLTAHGRVLMPAQVPVRAFPHIVVVSGDSREERRLGRTVAEHLSQGRSEVRVLSLSELAARDDTLDRRATATVLVALRFQERSRPTWARRNSLSCNAFGCFDARRSTIVEVPEVRARLDVTVRVPGRVSPIQTVQLTEEEAGEDVLAIRLRLLAALRQRLLSLFDQRTVDVPVELLTAGQPAVDDALEDIREGRWDEGRAQLERYAASADFQALPRHLQALVLYNLGQARRFDVSRPAEERFDAAADALLRAMRLVPEPRYAQALRELSNHRQSRNLVRAQEDARTHNFALGDGGEVPEPPADYR